MKRIAHHLALGILLLGSLTLSAQTRKLNLFIWSEYIDPKLVQKFEQKQQCQVVIDLYEDPESMMAKLQGGGGSQYDLVVPSDYLVQGMVRQGLLAPLRKDNIPNLTNLAPRFVNPPYDPGNRYTVAYQWGTLGVYARPNPGQELPATWGVIFDPKLAPGPILLIDSMRDLLGAALKYRGYSLNTTNLSELKEARDLVLKTKQRAQSLDASVGAKNKVLGKSARAAIVYSGEGLRGMREDTGTVYFIPKEGSLVWVDSIAVLAKAPQRDLAEKFINFILEPRHGAQISTFTQFSSPNAAALPLLDPKDLKDPALYPTGETAAKLEYIRDLGAKTRLYDEIWTQIKAR